MSSPQDALGWREILEESWPAVAAHELLHEANIAWTDDGVTSPSRDEAIGLAAMGKMVRYGQSITLNFPLGWGMVLPRISFYLHRLRLDAAQGLMCSPWFNRVTLASRQDLLIFGRPQRMMRHFATSKMMHPVVFHPLKPFVDSGTHRTVLISGHGDLAESLDQLETKSFPFAIVVVVGQHGCGANSIGLIKALPSYFPDVPVIALGYTGQTLDEPLRLHTWNTRLGDSVWSGSASRPPQAHHVEVMVARDDTMNKFVQSLGYQIWMLKQEMQSIGDQPQDFSALLAIDRAFRGLNVPLPVHEQGTLRRIRGGRFPIRLIQGWLDIASRIKGRRGDIKVMLDNVLELIRIGIRDLENATPGRAQAILLLAQEALTNREPLTIFVGSRRDAEILQNWIESQLGADCVGHITVLHLDGATATIPDHHGTMLYAAPFYPSRLHWLGLSAKRKIVLCHPFECQQVCSQSDRWWRANVLPSARFGDKRRLWTMDWSPDDPLKDLQVENGAGSIGFAGYTELELDGDYPQPLRVLEVEAMHQFDGWMAHLMAEPVRLDRDDTVDPQETKNIFVINFDGHEPLRCSANHQLMRLKGSDLTVCVAADLKVDDEVLLLGSSEDRAATQRDLFDMFVQNNHGLQQTLRVAEKWQEYVDGALEKAKTVTALHRYLKLQKYEVVVGTVGNWVAGGVIGPLKPAAIEMLAQLAGITQPEKMAKMVENAITAIRAEHRQIGKHLREAIEISRGLGVSAVKIGSRTFSREVFDAMVQVCQVVRIDQPAQGCVQEPQEPKTLMDVTKAFKRDHPTKIEFTPACERSIAKSSFEDLKSYEGILLVLMDGFYPMYASKSMTLQQVEDMLQVIHAEYAGRMSNITKGKYESDYFKIHNGEKVDISRHIKLGQTFDQRYTLRLYFHWDEKNSKIVVHHAGEHLPTQSS